MDFAASRRSTLGIEWELALVDPASGHLVGRAAEVIEAVGDPRVAGEFLTNTIELITGVHDDVGGATAELRELRALVSRAADHLGVGVVGLGAHPYSDWQLQTVVPDERYLRVVERTRQWGRQLAIWGVHVHIGLTSCEHAIPAMAAVLADYPMLLAISAGSPYWEGEDTGYASHRSMLFQQLPTGGIPPEFDDWAGLSREVDAMLAAGVVLDERELRWDVRPSSRFGTIEVRVFDSMATVAEVGAAAALTQCIVEEAVRALEAGRAPRRLPAWAVAENKFRAARWGFDTQFIIDDAGTVMHGREWLAQRIDELQPIARDLDCEAKVVSALSFAQATGADRQRAARRSGGGKQAIIDALRVDFLR
ncbi:MAG: YbdK family carboxylate-amine ligase [Microbacteriaceae bacterium]|nr:YbdK family carboxylate-amine ligase [Microbacteriaceae bacterium]